MMGAMVSASGSIFFGRRDESVRKRGGRRGEEGLYIPVFEHPALASSCHLFRVLVGKTEGVAKVVD